MSKKFLIINLQTKNRKNRISGRHDETENLKEEKRMKLKKLTAVGLAAVMCVMAAGCGSNGETNDKKQENTQKTQEKESGDSTEQEELVINYVSARGETDAALKTLKKIAEMYKDCLLYTYDAADEL